MKNPVNSPGSIFEASPYQDKTGFDVKDTLWPWTSKMADGGVFSAP